MLRLEFPNQVKDTGLALPDSTPKTLIQVDSENLPYACQCPCCGALFNLPEGLLYKVEEDDLIDGDLGADITTQASTDIDVNTSGNSTPEFVSSSTTSVSGTSPSTSEAGGSDDSFI